jgi:hypothetical protein
MSTFTYYIIALSLIIPEIIYSQSAVQAVRTDEPPVINGILSEELWQNAVPVTELFQREPNPGDPVSQTTEFYVLYDDDYLYIGVRNYDTGRIVAREMARSASLRNEDRVQIFLDTNSDGRTAYLFELGARGSKGDAIISANGQEINRDWQGLWDGKTSIHSYGWEAEFAIPFKTITFDENQTTWGIKFYRQIERNLEEAVWPLTDINARDEQVSDAGILVGLEGMNQGIGLDLTPWVLGGHNNREDGQTFMGDIGLDAFYQITPSLRGVVSINTDFAETEADTRQVNLTRFSLRFPEKREFFLDGANYFNFGISGEGQNPYSTRLIPFFSRRIGLDQSGSMLPVYAGAKFTGKVDNWNIGLLNVLQKKQFDNSNFTALRVSRNIGSQSSAGILATLGNATGPGSNALYGVDGRIATSTLGGNKNIALTGYVLQSQNDLPDGNRTTDYAMGADLNYPNDFFFGRTGFMHIDEDFEAGIGFVPRTGIRNYYLTAGIGPRPGKWGILQMNTEIQLDYFSDLNGTLLTREIELKPLEFRFSSGEELSSEVMFIYENLAEDFHLLGEILIPAGDYTFKNYSVEFETARQRNLWGAIGYEWGEFFNGKIQTYEISAGWQAFVNLFLGAEIERNFLNFQENKLDFGIYRMTVNVLFNPQINMTTFMQYDDISENLGWQTRFQWIIQPGQEFLVAWNSTITNDPLDRFALSESALRFKLKYNIRF